MWRKQLFRFFDDYILVLGEILFTFSLQTLRFASGNEFGNELTMRFGTDNNLIAEFLLMTAGLTIVVGWLADDLVGKFYITLIGVVAVILASFSNIIELLYPGLISSHPMSTSDCFFMTYISTSGVRNALILEQFRVFQNRKKDLRAYIWMFIIIRIVFYSFTPVLKTFEKLSDAFMFRIHLLSIITAFIYLLLLIMRVPNLYIEAVYFRIWEKCFLCVLTACTARPILRLKDAMTSPAKPILKEKPKKKKLWNFGIFKAKKKPEEKSKKKGVQFSNVLTLKFEGGATNEALPEPPVSKRTWGFKGIGSLIPIKKDKTKARNDSKLIADPVYLVKRDHWLRHARVLCPEYEISQTRKLLSSFPMVLPPFFFTLLTFIVLSEIQNQNNFILRDEHENPTIQYCVLFDILCFPLFEYFIYPKLHKSGFKELHFIFFGYLFLILAAASCLMIQIHLETTLQYLPNSQTTQFRIFNLVPSSTSVYTTWAKPEFLSPFDCFLVKDVPDLKIQVKIVNTDIELDSSFGLETVKRRTVSYVVSREGLISRNSDVDPTIFNRKGTVKKSTIFLVTYYKDSRIGVVFNGTRSFIMPSNDRGMALEIEPGKYSFYAYIRKSRPHLFGKFDILASTLYAFSLYYDENLVGNLHKLEGPLKLEMEYLMIPHVFLSVANAISSVSFFKHVFAISPEKLRSSIFSYIVALDLCAIALFEIIVNPFYLHTSKFILFHICVFIFVAFCYTLIQEKNT